MIYAVLILMALGQQAGMPGVENSVGYLASGTSIQPKSDSESSPMIHGSLGNWTMMLHANAVLVDIQQNKARGRDKLFSTNWFMPMAQRQFGRQSVTIRTMFSLEPATITQQRYPLLFQTGESAYGLSIIDGQHPHDLFMELAGRYELKVGESSQVFVYGGPIGEAALGPTAFPHRASASENPLAVLGHHMQDSTHISTNVITVGMAGGPIQIEASTFRGREPDENRWNVEKGKPDSFATRLTVAPINSISAQVSTGRINSPETLDPSLDTVRTTASVHHSYTFSSGHISSSLIWGRNKDVRFEAVRVFNSYNLEVTSRFLRKNWLWTRIENVDRDKSLLPVPAIPEPSCRLCLIPGFKPPVDPGASKGDNLPGKFNHVVIGPGGDPIFIQDEAAGRMQAFTLGYERELPLSPSWLNVGLGIQATTYRLPPSLSAVYGNRPSTIAAFLRIRPSGNMQDHMKLMHRQK